MATVGLYNQFKYDILNGVHDLNGAGDYTVLLVSGYTFDADDNYVSDVVASECSGTGYVRKVCATKTLTKDDTNDRAVWKFDSITWSGADWGDFDAMIVFLDLGGADSANPLISYHYIGVVTTDGSDEQIAIDPTEGALAIY